MNTPLSENARVDEPEDAHAVLVRDEAWAALSNNDRQYDGLFVYAVKTTGIFCRPSCGAKRPHRENVEFFADPQAAEEAGYRPCLRCRPKQAAGTPAEQAVEAARAYLEAHLDEQVPLERLAEEVGYSQYHLQRLFKRLIGLSPREYQNARRLETYKEEVRNDRTVLEATFEAGFGSSRALYEQAEAGLGMTPGTYRRGGDGTHIRYTILESRFGQVLVAATPYGVCSVSLGDNAEDLARELEEEFPNATRITRCDEGVQEWAKPIIGYLNGVHAHPTVPLDLEGTDFQRRVWHALREIPYGETLSYGEVARMLGRPKSARAVANACASNKVAFVVPCHRVVRKDGTPGGYRWGDRLKKRLLEKEAQSQEDID